MRLTESEATFSAEQKELHELKAAFLEMFKKHHNYVTVRTALSIAYHEFKLSHPTVKIFIPKPRVPSLKDGSMGNSELLHMEKSIDISFEDLSPRAKRLYLDTVTEIERKMQRESLKND